MWQHVKLSEQIHLWDTLACCREDKQPTNNLYFGDFMKYAFNIGLGSDAYASVSFKHGMMIGTTKL